MNLRNIIKCVVIFSTFLCIASCSKSQEELSSFVTSTSANDINSENFEESTLYETYELEGETEPELSEEDIALPFIMFSNRELSTEATTTTDGTLHLPEGEESTFYEYSVSCLNGYLDERNGVRRDISNSKFTYAISGSMEEDIITIKVFREGDYTATNYVHVKKILNAEGKSVFRIQRGRAGMVGAESK